MFYIFVEGKTEASTGGKDSYYAVIFGLSTTLQYSIVEKTENEWFSLNRMTLDKLSRASFQITHKMSLTMSFPVVVPA